MISKLRRADESKLATKFEVSYARYFTKLEKNLLSEICVRRIAGAQAASKKLPSDQNLMAES